MVTSPLDPKRKSDFRDAELILVKEGKPRIYRTQARPIQEWVHSELVFFDIEDEANVDQRRAEVGCRRSPSALR